MFMYEHTYTYIYIYMYIYMYIYIQKYVHTSESVRQQCRAQDLFDVGDVADLAGGRHFVVVVRHFARCPRGSKPVWSSDSAAVRVLVNSAMCA